MAHSSANFDQKRVTFGGKKCKNRGPPLRTHGNQPAASDPASTQGILIPWDSEGLATPLQQTKRNGRLREGFRVLRCRILAGRGPTVSVPGWARRMPFEVELNTDCKVLIRNVAKLFSVAEGSNQPRRMAFLRFHVSLALAWPPARLRPVSDRPSASRRPASGRAWLSSAQLEY